ncbi:hypothetical protein J1TS3_36360 [Siminovitchia fordii]|uniref:Uncharacterized protein n=1 Tax=Siminovitchia fordii TaxID=254759 RepID=A0ABQ4KBV5_9BACI|nr:hypothetical protein J1TS3_36360 [Siminovitchia fordii]
MKNKSMFEVFDDRTDEVVFSSEYKQDCINFMTKAASDDEKFLHYWLREVK